MRRRALLATALLLPAIAGRGAAASPIDDAKAQGLVGERVDGYAGVVAGNAPAAVRKLVDEVNAGRQKGYAAIAERRKVGVDEVAALAGKKLVDQAPKGAWVMGADGTWRQKP